MLPHQKLNRSENRVTECVTTEAAARTFLGVMFFALWSLPLVTESAEIPTAGFEVSAEPVFQELSASFCWFHPRAAAMPGYGTENPDKSRNPAVVITIQKHLSADDHYSGMYFLRTDDLGKKWTEPTEIPELAWKKGPKEETIAVCDVTPGWHQHSRKLLLIGTKLRYSSSGAQLLDQPRSHECAYATYSPTTNRWTEWKTLELPHTEDKFFLVAPGCVQWMEQADGTLLIPVYVRGPSGDDYQATILHCFFDGREIRYLEHGDILAVEGGRGFCEPSLTRWRQTYFLTLRNDNAAYVTTGNDGLHFGPVRKWTFDDGKDLGSYNTQAHWLTHSEGLYLTYTRRGADNDHITRNRAPLFVAQVNPTTLQVIRDTERVLLPERGVMLGNFGAAGITPLESWVTDSEYILGGVKNARGADGTTWLGRVRWKLPNLLVPQ